MDQATVSSDLRNQLVELRKEIASNSRPDVSEEAGPAPICVVVFPVAPSGPLPGVPPENTPLDPPGEDMDADVEEMSTVQSLVRLECHRRNKSFSSFKP